MASEGTFVLADIGGYTSFLAGVGLTHGKEITEHLLNRLIKRNRGRWKVGNVMGDCVFFYSEQLERPEDTFNGVRSLYEAFQDAQLDVASGSTCQCGACNRTEELSLKFVVHAGEYDVQNIGGRKELIGQEIVRATRLLKNSVPVKEYLVVTGPVAGVAHAAGVSPTTVCDHLESMGPIEYSYIDLGPMREAYEKSRAFYLTAEDSNLTVIADVDAPADMVWAAMSDIDKRRIWQVTVKEISHIQGGHAQVGEVHSCVHNDGTTIVHATIAIDGDGRRMTERVWVAPAMIKDMYITTQAEQQADGRTRVTLYAAFKPRFPVLSHVAWPLFALMMKRSVRKDLAGLKEYCETGKVAAREAAASRSIT